MAIPGQRRKGRARTSLPTIVCTGLLALCAFSAATDAGDPELAKFLLQHGREALEKGNPADALTKFQKAREEDATLVDVIYWIGAALEARGDTAGAVEEYRAFLAALAARNWPLTKDLVALQKKATVRLDALDAGRREIEKAHDAFAAQVLEFAGRVKKTDPDLAGRALRLVLAVKPKHAAVETMLASLAADGGGGDDPLRGLEDLWDLVASHGLGKNNGWTYLQDAIEVKLERGALTRTPDGYDSGPTYALVIAVRREAVLIPGRATVVGLTFGWVGEEGFTLVNVDDELRLETFGKSGRNVLARKALPAWPADGRRTLAVRAEGKRFTCYLDGRPVIQHEVTSREHLGGDIGVVFENVALKVRQFTFGRPAAKGK